MNLLRTILTLFLLATPVWAWGVEGHTLVSDIAWDRLDPIVQARTEQLLSHHPDSRIRTLSEASLWPDLIRDRSHSFHFYNRPDWHYQDRLVNETDRPVTLEGKLLEKLEEQCRVLSDKESSQRAKAVALSWVAHLVGDIHQPLHNSELYDERFPEGDRGGNLYEVVLGGETLSFHYLWDSAGGRFLYPPSSDRLRSYQTWFVEKHPPESFAELEVHSFQAWSDEGLALAVEAYGNVPFGEKISTEALESVMDVSERRIVLAGYRLAKILEEALK
jgi:hypothetical protein